MAFIVFNLNNQEEPEILDVFPSQKSALEDFILAVHEDDEFFSEDVFLMNPKGDIQKIILTTEKQNIQITWTLTEATLKMDIINSLPELARTHLINVITAAQNSAEELPEFCQKSPEKLSSATIEELLGQQRFIETYVRSLEIRKANTLPRQCLSFITMIIWLPVCAILWILTLPGKAAGYLSRSSAPWVRNTGKNLETATEVLSRGVIILLSFPLLVWLAITSLPKKSK